MAGIKGLPRLCDRIVLELEQAISRAKLLATEEYIPSASAQLKYMKEQILRAEMGANDIYALIGRANAAHTAKLSAEDKAKKAIEQPPGVKTTKLQGDMAGILSLPVEEG